MVHASDPNANHAGPIKFTGTYNLRTARPEAGALGTHCALGVAWCMHDPKPWLTLDIVNNIPRSLSDVDANAALGLRID